MRHTLPIVTDEGKLHPEVKAVRDKVKSEMVGTEFIERFWHNAGSIEMLEALHEAGYFLAKDV